MVRLGPGVDSIELREALLIFLPRWPFRVSDAAPAVIDIDVTIESGRFRIAAVSWDGGESLAEDFHNAANALAGLLIDAILAHRMAFCCLHAAAVEIAGAAYLFAGPSEAGKSTLALRLAARGCRHLADDRILLMAGEGPWRVTGLGLAAKARQPLPPGPELAALLEALYEGQALADGVIAHMLAAGFVEAGRHNVSLGPDGQPIQADFLFRRNA